MSRAIGEVARERLDVAIFDGRMFLWNEAARRPYGYDAQEVEATGFLHQIESCGVQLREKNRKMARKKFGPERMVAKP